MTIERTLTREQFDALPDVTERHCAIFQGEDDGLVTDPVDGSQWLVGRLDGVRVKRRLTLT